MRALALITLLASSWAAAAPSPRLVEARKLIDDLEMESALKALDAADKSEGNDRATVLEIWTLQGIAFGTLGKEAKTRDSFRKLLVLDPSATIPQDLPPRVRTPFFEAREWAATNGPIGFTAGVNLEGGVVQSVKVTVDKDVLRLARTARFHLELEGKQSTLDVPITAGKAEAPVQKEGVSWWAEVLSDRKGVLFTVASAEQPRRDGQVGAPVAAAPLQLERPVPVSGGWRRPTGFVLVGAGAVAAGIGIVLGVQSSAARARLTDAARDAQGRVTGITQAEAGPLEASANTQATVANVLFGVGGALGAAGVVLVILGPSEQPALALSPAPAGVLVSGHF